MIQNKVAESELITLDLKQFLPGQHPVHFDLKDYLFRGLILKEKDFRESLSNLDLDKYHNQVVLVYCSADVIIPVWAYMLTVMVLKKDAKEIFFGNEDSWRTQKLLNEIDRIDFSMYKDRRIVIKGCGDEKIPDAAFFAITNKLIPVVKSLMYGEPCSTVPIYKRK